MQEVKHYKVKTLPSKTNPNSVYYVKATTQSEVKTYITDQFGQPFPLIDLNSGNGTGSVNSVTGTGVTGTNTNPVINITTFKSSQLGNLLQLSTTDSKLFVKPIISPNQTIDIIETTSALELELSQELQDLINIAIKPGDNISELTNDAGYITESQTLAQTLVSGNETLGKNVKVNNNDAIELENGSLLKKGSYSFGNNGDVIVSGITNTGDGYIAGIMGWGNPSGTQWSDLNGTYVKTSVAVTPSAYGIGDIGMHTPEPGTYNYYLQNPLSLGTLDPAWNGIAYFLAPGNRSGWGDPNDNGTTDTPVNYWRLCVLSDYPYVYFTNPSSDPYNFPTLGWVPVDNTIPNSEGGNGYTYIADYGGGFTASNINIINGNGGISRICSVGYEDMWQAGIRYTFDLGGNIREATNCFNIVPDFSFDNTQRFKVDSLWVLDNGATYKCLDVTTGAAVWELQSIGSSTLQEVTDNGSITDKAITVQGVTISGNVDNFVTNIGADAGSNNSGIAVSNLGYKAGENNTGSNVTNLAQEAGRSNTGNNVINIGLYAGVQNTGNNVINIGVQAGRTNTGNNVTNIGVDAGQDNSGDSVTNIGSSAGIINTLDNVINLGLDAQATATNQLALNTGLANTVINLPTTATELTLRDSANVESIAYLSDITGAGTLQEVTDNGATTDKAITVQGVTISGDVDNEITNVGEDAGTNNTGTIVTNIGKYAGLNNTGSNVTNIGRGAGTNNTGNDATNIGRGAGQNNSKDFVTNVGAYAGESNTGESVINIGNDAGYNNTLNNVINLGRSAQATATNQLALNTGVANTVINLPATDTELTLRDSASVESIAYLSDITTSVTSVSATSPITSSGGTTPTISTSMDTNKLIGRSTAGTGVMEEITLGTGLSFSGTTLNATGASPLTTKGDLYTFDTANTRLPIGLNNQVLTVDTTTATGLKWTAQNTPTPLGYYGAWQDMQTQTAAASNVGYPLIFRTIDLENQVRVVTNGTNLTRITFDNTGIYNLQFSVQVQNTDNAQHDLTIWIRKNGVDVDGSAGFVSVPPRKSAGVGNEGHTIAGWNYLLSIVAGEYYEIVWSTTDATHVTIKYYAGANPPPSTASVLATVTQQSGIMAGTGITALNNLVGTTQSLITGTAGTNFTISSTGSTHIFNLPDASITARGLVGTGSQTFEGIKTFNANVGITQITPTSKLHIKTDAIGNTTPAISSGIHLENTTAATATIFQNSPSLTLTGAAHSTVGGTGSKISRFQMFVRPSINSTGATDLLIQSTTNDTTVITPFVLSQNGSLTITNNFTAFSSAFSSGVTFNSQSNIAISGNTNGVSTTQAFGPTSGTATANYINIAPTINQTGGASGITRGVYVNPTATATADWRAIETTNGKVILADTISAGSGSLTGSLLDMTQTWNTTGAPTAIKLNVTNTASAGASRLIDLQVGGVSQFFITRVQSATFVGTVNAGSYTSTAGLDFATLGNNSLGSNTIPYITTTGTFAPTSGSTSWTLINLAPTINQTGGASGIFRGYYFNPTITSAVDVRAIETTNGRVVLSDTWAAGGGTSSTRAGALLDMTQTWNTGVGVTAMRLNVIDTANLTTSNIFDFQINGSSALRLQRNGGNLIGSAFQFSAGSVNNDFSAGSNGTALTVGNSTNISSTRGFIPTTGTATFNAFGYTGTINQTGGASGISRGLFINPTLTIAADFRAIETTNGKVILADTVSAGSGSLAGSLLDLRQTWNTTGAVTAIKLNVTNTASAGNSFLMDLQVGGVSQFRVDRIGGQISVGTINSNSSFSVPNNLPISSTSGNFVLYGGSRAFGMSSGTATITGFIFDSAINQTGTASGITRGLYINPTLTSAADFRAIEVTAGKLVFSSTITATGTTGAQTINKISGKVNAAAATTSLVVTNSLVTTSSIVMCQLGTNDSTCVIKSVVEGNGSFTINYVAPTAETAIKFTVIN